MHCNNKATSEDAAARHDYGRSTKCDSRCWWNYAESEICGMMSDKSYFSFNWTLLILDSSSENTLLYDNLVASFECFHSSSSSIGALRSCCIGFLVLSDQFMLKRGCVRPPGVNGPSLLETLSRPLLFSSSLEVEEMDMRVR